MRSLLLDTMLRLRAYFYMKVYSMLDLIACYTLASVTLLYIERHLLRGSNWIY